MGNEEVTGKAKSAAALAKVNAERAAAKAAKAAKGGAADGEQGAGDVTLPAAESARPTVVKSFRELNLLTDELF